MKFRIITVKNQLSEITGIDVQKDDVGAYRDTPTDLKRISLSSRDAGDYPRKIVPAAVRV